MASYVVLQLSVKPVSFLSGPAVVCEAGQKISSAGVCADCEQYVDRLKAVSFVALQLSVKLDKRFLQMVCVKIVSSMCRL